MFNVKKTLTRLLNSIRMGTPTTITLPYIAPCDGLLMTDHRPSASGNSYIQVKIGSQYYVGQASTWAQSHLFPVQKGAEIKLNNSSNASDIVYKFIPWGGFCINCIMSTLSRLAERWWEYAEHKETTYEISDYTDSDSYKGRLCVDEWSNRVVSQRRNSNAEICWYGNREHFVKDNDRNNSRGLQTTSTDCSKCLWRSNGHSKYERRTSSRPIGWSDILRKLDLYNIGALISERGCAVC